MPMRVWLMSGAVHYQNIENADNLPKQLRGAFPYDGVPPHHPLSRGDWVYLCASVREIYCTGTVSRIETYRDDRTGRELLRVFVNRQMIPDQKWVTADEVTAVPELTHVYDELDDHLIPLRPRQINALNRLVERHGGTPAPEVREDEEYPKFVLNQEVTLEEMRGVEFKQIRGTNPAHSIRDIAEDYAVAYLNVRTGSVYWGIRDDRVVSGVPLTYGERQRIREQFSVQFAQIQPAVSLLNGSVAFYPVLDEADEKVNDLWVCEIHVKSADPKQLYSTGSGRVYMKTDGGKQLLDAEHIAAERERRRLLL
jgi:hypothetical protein